MKKHNNKTVWLPVTGVAFGVGLAFLGWTHFSETAPVASTSPDSVPASATAPRSRADRASAPEATPTPSLQKESFLAQAQALRARIDAGDKISEGQIRKLLAEWAQSDPEAALSFALSPTQDGISEAFFEAADSAMTVWAKKEPEKARAYLEHLAEDPRIVAELAPATMRVYAELSLPKAQEWVQSGFADDSGELRPVLARELVSVLVGKGKEREVEKWLANTKVAESAYALPAVSEYSRLLATRDVDDALAFSKALPRGSMSRSLALQSTVQAWASHDADDSYDWIVGRKAIDQSRPELFAGSGKKSPIPAGAYTSDELDYAISGYVLALAPTFRDEAMASAAGIHDDSLRRRIQQQVASINPPTPSRAEF